MESRINYSVGVMEEAINRSEGEKERRVNEAEGTRAEIVALAKATATAIEKISSAIESSGGEDAVILRMASSDISQRATHSLCYPWI